MAESIPMLALSPTMTEGTIAAWKYKEGDTVTKGSVLCEVETDKAVMDYESSSAGVLLKILAPQGSTVPVGDLIAVVGAAGENVSALAAKSAAAAPAATAGPAGLAGPAAFAAVAPPAAIPPAASPEPAHSKPMAAAAGAPISGGVPSMAPGFPPSSPLARNLARNAGLDLRSISGTGPRGRVVKRDVEDILINGPGLRSVSDAASGAASSVSGPKASGAPSAAAASAPSGAAAPSRKRALQLEDRTVPLSRIRATIAKRLVASMQDAPHFFLRSAVEADRLKALRGAINEGRQEADRISLNTLFVKLSAAAIARNPEMNAIWRDTAIEYRRSVDIALAVAIPDGLVAPVVRDCVRKGFEEIELEFKDLIQRAKAGALKPEDYEGATFTISNLGAWGIEEFTAIINPPGSSILALGSIIKEPVVHSDDQGRDSIVVRSMLRATLSCDHRSIDGALGAAFLRDFKGIIEEPARALL